ncbi:AfsR/SARP family transcriptional regulator [Micromonospora sp. NBC_01813]|uniref:AfsR/SARP family transcriptional regulator n=1 Tax=Micromonospora sp. NBC_01813 TaxID=2975988 RepID=UPI002DDC2672|nr:AfsR/SARP family transcriptional regulator [Micromonospora sp. NBC_01813]WSA07518.1 AfsR/SARP family transcriptional regulator [Micromonospora sp. NBC_01813]
MGTGYRRPDGPTLRFSLLGPIRAFHGSAEIPLGSPQQRSTLAILLLRRRELATIDELVGAVWGEEPPRAAVSTVRTYVSRLRKLLAQRIEAGPDPITSMAGGYLLRVPAESIDVWRFQRHTEQARAARERLDLETAAAELRTALRLRHGPPLAHATGPYLDAQRLWLDQLMTAAVEDRLAVDLQRGRHAETIGDLCVLVCEHPLRERLRELLMLALYRSGRQADALEQYHQARRLLVDQLGIEPGAGLRRLHQQILTADPDLLPDPQLLVGAR